MSAKKSKPKFSEVSRPEYDASRDKVRSGKHKAAGVLVRAPDAERESWSRDAARVGLDRSSFIRAALALVRNRGGWPREIWARQLEELEAVAKKDRAKKGLK